MLGLVYLAALLLAWRVLLWRPRRLPGVTRRTPWLLGHRGVRGPQPENTLAAFRYALDAGLDGLECDVQKCRDGALVLTHDFEVGGRRVETLSLADIQAHDPHIPTLEALFNLADLYPGTLLNVEIKADSWRTNGVEHDVAQAIFRAGLEGRVVVSSFNPMSLARFRWHAPRLRVGLLYAPNLPPLLRSGRLAGWLHVDALHPHESQVTLALLYRAHARGLMVNTWTVNDPKRISSLHAQKVDAIIGDDPAVLRRAAQDHPEESDRAR